MASDRDAFPCDTTLKAQTPHSTDFITLHIIRQAVRRGCASVSTASQFWLHLPLDLQAQCKQPMWSFTCQQPGDVSPIQQAECCHGI